MHLAHRGNAASLIQPVVSHLASLLASNNRELGNEYQQLKELLKGLVTSAKRGQAISYATLVFIAEELIVEINASTEANKEIAHVLMKATHAWPFLLQSSEERNLELKAKLEDYGFSVGTKNGLANRVLDPKDTVALILHNFISRVRLRKLRCSNYGFEMAIQALPSYSPMRTVQKDWTDLASEIVKLHSFQFPGVDLKLENLADRREWLRKFKRRFLLQADVMQTKQASAIAAIQASLTSVR